MRDELRMAVQRDTLLAACRKARTLLIDCEPDPKDCFWEAYVTLETALEGFEEGLEL